MRSLPYTTTWPPQQAKPGAPSLQGYSRSKQRITGDETRAERRLWTWVEEKWHGQRRLGYEKHETRFLVSETQSCRNDSVGPQWHTAIPAYAQRQQLPHVSTTHQRNKSPFSHKQNLSIHTYVYPNFPLTVMLISIPTPYTHAPT